MQVTVVVSGSELANASDSCSEWERAPARECLIGLEG